MVTTFRIESTVRGHHVYKAAWSPYIGEELPVQREVNNIHNDFAVAVLKNGNTVGHVPREISRVCWYFLHKSGSEMTCIVNGHRRRSKVNGKGLMVPMNLPSECNSVRVWALGAGISASHSCKLDLRYNSKGHVGEVRVWFTPKSR